MKSKMKLKNKIAELAAVSLMLTSAQAFATGAEGHGGGAEVCYTDATKTVIKSVNLYDLYEGSDHLNIPDWNRTEKKGAIILRVLTKIETSQPGLARDMRAVLDQMTGLIRDRPSAELALVNDVKRYSTGTNCEYRQMINWLDPNEYAPNTGNIILRDQTFYKDQFNPLNQAALDLHEAAYKVYRAYLPNQYAQYGSVAVRNLIAEAFSAGEISTELVPGNAINEGFFDAGNWIKDGDTANRVHSYYLRSSSCDPDDINLEITYLDGNANKAKWHVGLENYRPWYKNNLGGYLKLGDSQKLKLTDLSKLSSGLDAPGIRFENISGWGKPVKAHIQIKVTGCNYVPLVSDYWIEHDTYISSYELKVTRPKTPSMY